MRTLLGKRVTINNGIIQDDKIKEKLKKQFKTKEPIIEEIVEEVIEETPNEKIEETKISVEDKSLIDKYQRDKDFYQELKERYYDQ